MRTKARGTAVLKPSSVRSAESHEHVSVFRSCLLFLSLSVSGPSLSLPILVPNLSGCLSFTHLFILLSWCIFLFFCHYLFSLCLSCVCSVSCLSWCLIICISLSLSTSPLHKCSVILSTYLPLTGCPSSSPTASVSLSLSCKFCHCHSLSLSSFLCHVLSVSLLLIIIRAPMCTQLIGATLSFYKN